MRRLSEPEYRIWLVTSGLIRTNAATWSDLLSGSGDLSRRSSPQVWSTVEYACHVRDVFRLYDERLSMMLSEVGPLYPNWDQDQTAVEQRYGEQDIKTVRMELLAAAARLAEHFDQVSGEQWGRTGRRSDGAKFTVATFARYFIHDPIHHLHDVMGAPTPRT